MESARDEGERERETETEYEREKEKENNALSCTQPLSADVVSLSHMKRLRGVSCRWCIMDEGGYFKAVGLLYFDFRDPRHQPPGCLRNSYHNKKNLTASVQRMELETHVPPAFEHRAQPRLRFALQETNRELFGVEETVGCYACFLQELW